MSTFDSDLNSKVSLNFYLSISLKANGWSKKFDTLNRSTTRLCIELAKIVYFISCYISVVLIKSFVYKVELSIKADIYGNQFLYIYLFSCGSAV